MAKYTEEVLREAVAESRSMTDVLRHFGLALNGGSHAHLRRRITGFGIPTDHFTRMPRRSAGYARRRRNAAEVLVLRAPDAKRAVPEVLRRALVETGRRYECAICGLGDTWQNQRLTLHVDHVDGRFWDCRADNLRFLCPNCHSQTATYAGRNRRQYARPTTPRMPEAAGTGGPPDEAEVVRILRRVDGHQLTVTAAAQLIGCHRNHVRRLRRRLHEDGLLRGGPRRPSKSAVCRDAVIRYALAHPDLGPKKIASQLRELPHDPVQVSHGTVATILACAGLRTCADRRAAAGTDQTASATA